MPLTIREFTTAGHAEVLDQARDPVCRLESAPVLARRPRAVVRAALPLAAMLSAGAGATDLPAALRSVPIRDLPPGHDEALSRFLANRPPHDPDRPRGASEIAAAWEWRPTPGDRLAVSRACEPGRGCLIAVYRVDGGDVDVLFSTPREWWPLSDAAILSTDTATKDLIVSDPQIGQRRATFVRVGKGVVMDASSYPSPKANLELAVRTAVTVLDAWREKQPEILATQATYPFVATFSVRDRKHPCESKTRTVTARDSRELRGETAALFGHPFRRESVLGRLMDPVYAAWRTYEPDRSTAGARGSLNVQVELFDLPRGVDSLITVEVSAKGEVRWLSYEDFAWAERLEDECNND